MEKLKKINNENTLLTKSYFFRNTWIENKKNRNCISLLHIEKKKYDFQKIPAIYSTKDVYQQTVTNLIYIKYRE